MSNPLSEDCPRCRAPHGSRCRGGRGDPISRPHKGRETLAALRADNATLRLRLSRLEGGRLPYAPPAVTSEPLPDACAQYAWVPGFAWLALSEQQRLDVCELARWSASRTLMALPHLTTVWVEHHEGTSGYSEVCICVSVSRADVLNSLPALF